MIPPPGAELCALDDLADGRGTAIDLCGADGDHRLFIIRRGDELRAYVNACAHFGIELNPAPDHTFLTPDGTAIRCQHHGALFAIEDGRCIKGACDGEGLTPVPVRVDNGRVVVADNQS